MANGVPVDSPATVIPKDKHPVTKESMDNYVKSYEAILRGPATVKDFANIMGYDPNAIALATGFAKKLAKFNIFSQPYTSISHKYPVTPLQSSLLENFVGYKKLR